MAAATDELVIHNPATGERAGSVTPSDRDDVRRAVAAARAAQPGWERLGIRRRAELLTRFHDLLFEREAEVLDTIQRESGKPRREALVELLTVAGTARYYLVHGEGHLAERDHPGATPFITGARVIRRPHGVAGFITPWNYPFILSIGDAIPALLAGNTAVIKPSEITPLSAELGVRLLHLAGFDDDVVQLVHGGGPEVGGALVEEVDYIGFTGSAATGRKIAVAAGERLIPYSLELGGKNPMIVLERAPIEPAVDGLVTGAFYNAGQTCIGIERVYVQESIFERFVERARERAREVRLGYSQEWEVDMGCLISDEHCAKVMGHIDDAIAGGATVVTGGRRRQDLGPTFVEPTLLTDVDPGMELHAEETFGPVVAIYPIVDEEEAVRRANDTAYGLNAALWTGLDGVSQSLARRIDAGSVHINSSLLVYNTFDVPMGGVKESGVGRRHGAEGIQRFTRTHSIVSSVTTAGGYEGLLSKIDSPGRARALSRAFKLMRRIPGLR